MNKRIVISVGHGRNAKGGYDSGAVSKDGRYHEFRIARDIAKLVSDRLGCDLINYAGDRSLTQRIKDVNAGGYDFAAEIHLNAGGGTGTETYYYHGSPTGRRAADEICRGISENLGVRNRGAKVKLNAKGTDYFGFIRQTKPCAVLIETVFIDCARDLKNITGEEGKRKCAAAIAEGIEKALGKGERK